MLYWLANGIKKMFHVHSRKIFILLYLFRKFYGCLLALVGLYYFQSSHFLVDLLISFSNHFWKVGSELLLSNCLFVIFTLTLCLHFLVNFSVLLLGVCILYCCIFLMYLFIFFNCGKNTHEFYPLKGFK